MMIMLMEDKIKNIIVFLISISFVFPFISCRKASHNGDLDGNWRIISIEDIDDGLITNPQQKFIAFQLHIVRLSPNGVAGNLQYEKDEAFILLDFPYMKDASGESLLSQYGIESNPAKFKIEKMTSNQLIIRSKDTIISCERF